MRNVKKLAALGLSLVLAAGSMAACGKKAEPAAAPTEAPTQETTETPTEAPTQTEPVDIALKVWGPQEEQTAYDGYGDSLLKFMCDRFNEQHPEWNITFTYGVVSEADCKTELSKDAAAGADVFMFASDQTAQMHDNGILAPIVTDTDAIISGNGGETAGSISAATFDGDLYAVPFTPNSWFMYYDKSKYTEDEVKNLDTMMAKDLGDDAYNFSMDIDNGWYLASFFFANGCSLFGANGQDATVCDFNGPNGLAVGNYLVDLETSPKFLMETDNGANAIAQFKDGKLGAWCSGTWNAQSVQEALGDNYAAAKLPTITVDGKEGQLKSFADYKYIGVNANTSAEAMPAAQALAAYLGGEECQKDRFIARSIAPTLSSLTSDPDVVANTAVAALSLQSGYTQFQSTISQMGNYWSPAEGFGAGIYNKEITKDNMQDALDDFVTNILTALE